MTSLTVRAPAKINLHLGVGAARSDGFHPLHTIYQAVGLYDDVEVTIADAWSVEVNTAGAYAVDVSGVPRDESNIAVRAAQVLLAHHGRDERCAITIEKGIPVAGGMAGGSADAAATLVAVDRLLDLQTTDDDLLVLAAGLGSDVPFALIGGTALGSGRGEIVEPLTDHGEWWWVVVPSAGGLSTPVVYAEFDRLGLPGHLDQTEHLLDALALGDPGDLSDCLINDLQPAALSLEPSLGDTLDALEYAGARTAIVSGSGPTCLGLADDPAHARQIVQGLRERGIEHALSAPAPVAGTHVVAWA